MVLLKQNVKIMGTIIAKYRGPSGRTILFEPDESLQSPGWVSAKKYMNSIFLESGHFEQYQFHQQAIVSPTQEEEDYYIALKDRSIHLIGK